MSDVKLKGELIHTGGELPAVGSKAPNFSLVDASLTNRHLSDFQGKRKLISIVPSLDTDVCLTSSKKFNEAAKAHPSAVILIVSADLPFAQKRVCGLENLENIIPLSIMRSRDFAYDYGVLIKDGPMEGLTARAVLVLDENNIVVHSELVEEITSEPNYDQALENLG
ncbi:MAG: Thiol peroxidase [Chlamydiia bacterium]|nr:Thiol peroxidase [Chlamydiia bacterium]MCH9615601.1 Thiol peroxidase [Chlamydiia bacterium]MCH9628996.1 Thiol peroxidase [Chlamydiia bacterium]